MCHKNFPYFNLPQHCGLSCHRAMFTEKVSEMSGGSVVGDSTAARQADVKPRLNLGSLTPVAKWFILTLYFLAIRSDVGKVSSRTAHFILFARPWPGSCRDSSQKTRRKTPSKCCSVSLCSSAPAIEATAGSVG